MPRHATPSPARLQPVYSRGERIADAVLHIIGVSAALAAVPVLVTLVAIRYGDGPTIAATAVYGAALITMLALSAAYHLVRRPRLKEWLRRCDHAAIYVKIAGTYTPFAVLSAGAQAAALLTGVWIAALAGLALKLAAPRRWEGLALALYLGMGWAVLAVGGPILDGLSTAGLALVLTGGGLYTLGVGFHLWHRLPFHNAIWHGLVLAASFVFYAAVLVEVLRHAPVA